MEGQNPGKLRGEMNWGGRRLTHSKRKGKKGKEGAERRTMNGKE